LIPTLEDLATTAVNAIAIGIGSAFGAYLANKALIVHLEKLAEKINACLEQD
jgi:shikimate kinase